jgi:uncharacterized membrane protein
MAILTSLALWLHDLATVLLIGHYALLVVVYLPLIKSGSIHVDAGLFLKDVTRRVQPWMGISLLTFVVTGILLMVANPDYLGVGQFGNRWSVLMLGKHIVVIGMVALASWIAALTRPAAARTAKAAVSNPHPPFLYRIDRLIQVQAVLGVLVLFMTAVARMG